MSTGMRTKAASPLSRASGSGYAEVEWIDSDGAHHASPVTAGLWTEPFELNLPTREGVQYQNRRNRHVSHFWSPTESFVWCESAFEHQCLNLLEFEGDIAAVSSQPFRILFAATTALRSHDPDFFGLRHDGSKVVIDVKPSNFHTEKVQLQFAETKRICDLVGWDYRVMDHIAPALLANLCNLRPNRLRRAHPSTEVWEQARSVFEDGLPLAQGRLLMNRRHPALAMAAIKHLIWHGHLAADLDQPLGMHSILTTTREEGACCL